MAYHHTFKIVAPLNQRAAYVEMDGQRLKGVTAISLKLSADSKPTALLIEVQGEVLVEGEFKRTDILTVARQGELA